MVLEDSMCDSVYDVRRFWKACRSEGVCYHLAIRVIYNRYYVSESPLMLTLSTNPHPILCSTGVPSATAVRVRIRVRIRGRVRVRDRLMVGVRTSIGASSATARMSVASVCLDSCTEYDTVWLNSCINEASP